MAKEIDILEILARGWVTAIDPITDADLSGLPNIENFSTTFPGAAILERGYVESGLTTNPVAGAVVCLAVLELETGKIGMIYGGGGALYAETVSESGVSDDGAAGGYI